MVGDSTSATGLVVRGSGTTDNPFDALDYTGPSLRGVWGTGPDDVWVAPYQGPIGHWDGTAWTTATAPASATDTLLGIGGSRSSDVWAVGLSGLVLHYDGQTWSPSATKTTSVLWSVWSSGPSDAWVVGGDDTLIHWNGSSWSPSP
jgi:hypothetical protein